MQDFASYRHQATRAYSPLWKPDLLSLVLGIVMGAGFTLFIVIKLSDPKIPLESTQNQEVVEQPHEKAFNFEFYDILKNR